MTSSTSQMNIQDMLKERKELERIVSKLEVIKRQFERIEKIKMTLEKKKEKLEKKIIENKNSNTSQHNIPERTIKFTELFNMVREPDIEVDKYKNELYSILKFIPKDVVDIVLDFLLSKHRLLPSLYDRVDDYPYCDERWVKSAIQCKFITSYQYCNNYSTDEYYFESSLLYIYQAMDYILIIKYHDGCQDHDGICWDDLSREYITEENADGMFDNIIRVIHVDEFDPIDFLGEMGSENETHKYKFLIPYFQHFYDSDKEYISYMSDLYKQQDERIPIRSIFSVKIHNR